MQLKNYSFEELPFSALFKTYTTNFDKVSAFYEANPFDSAAVKEKAEAFSFKGNRSDAVEVLKKFNQQFDAGPETFENLERLMDERSLAIITGQQLGVYGGPIYTFFKTLTTIHLASHWEKVLDRPVIPVFWLADEDHDYDEVRSLMLLDGDDPEEAALPSISNHLPPVANLSLPDSLTDLRSQVRDILLNTDFKEGLWELLDGCYEPGTSFVEAFGNLLTRLFSKFGLVLAGSNDASIKKLTSGYMKQAISHADAIRESLDEQSREISRKYHQQVTLYDSNLFYLDGQEGRVKINRNGNGWKTDSGREWTSGKLLDVIDENPESFSPNVFLRPILQDRLLPTLGYVAGPGEIAYYGQMKKMYQVFDTPMPIIFPRLSATFIEPAIDRISAELPFEIHEYNKRIEDLESEFVERTEQVDIEAIFKGWKEKVQNLSNIHKDEIAEVDPTLEGAAGKATAVYFGELDKLKGKVYRAVKQQQHTQLKRIRRIKAQLFPNGELQERAIASIYYMNKYGVDLWDQLLGELADRESFNHHKLIYL